MHPDSHNVTDGDDAPPPSAAAGAEHAPASRARAKLTARWHRLSLARRIAALVIVLLSVVHGANILLLFHYYGTVAAREREARDARATLLAEHAGRSLGAVDLSLETIVNDLKTKPYFERSSIFTQMLLDGHAKRLPQLRALFTVDQAGHSVNDSRTYPAPALDLSDRDYFIEQRKWRGVGLYISPALTSRRDGKPMFVMSRPVLDNDGNFRGLVGALAEPAYFAGFYGARGFERGEMVLLVRTDGAVLAGSDATGRQIMDIGRRLADFGGLGRLERTVRDVPGFPLRIVLFGSPAFASSQFLTFLAMDMGLVVVMSLIAWWLATALAREVSAREMSDVRLLDAIESGPAGFALYDRDDRLVMSNSLMAQFFPQTPEAVTPGTFFRDVLHSAHAAHGYANIPKNMSADDHIRWRMERHQAGDSDLILQVGAGRWVLVRERQTKEGGIVCFYTDITPLKEQEEALRRARQRAEEADRTKSAFLASMSHELRTPLNAIIGYSDMIMRQIQGPVTATYRQYADAIHTSGHHLLAIINDLLDIAKLQAGKTELRLEKTDLVLTLDEAMRMVERKAADTQVAITKTVEADLPPIDADPIRLRQIFLNLLSNAVKFTPAGGRVSVKVDRTADQVRLVVSDTGIGIASEDIPRVLEPFVQVQSQLTRQHEGTGLGLPISKRLIELHGGQIEIESTRNVGTTVTVRLPLPTSPAKDARPRGVALAAAGAGK